MHNPDAHARADDASRELPWHRLCRATGIAPLRGLRAAALSLPAQAWTCPKSRSLRLRHGAATCS